MCVQGMSVYAVVLSFFFFVEVTGCEDLAAQFRGSSNSSHRESGFHGIM
jgi:hypothetical protein